MFKFLALFLFVSSISGENFNFHVQIEDVQYSKLPENYQFRSPNVEDFVPRAAEVKDLDFGEGKSTRGIHATVNEFADEIFANIKEFMIHQGFDPARMPDLHTGFNYTFIITYHGELDLTKGWINDISSIHRGGDVDVEYTTTTKFLKVTVPIAFDVLQFNYDYSAKIMGLGPTGGVEGKVTDIKVLVEIGFDVNNFVASLDKFDITNSGHISVHFTGNILIDWLINLLSEVVTTLLKPIILAIVEGIIKGGLTSVIDLINSVIGGILNPPEGEIVAPEAAARMIFKNILN